MIIIGQRHDLKVVRIMPQGAYLQDELGEELLLPKRYVPSDVAVDDEINVFAFKDHLDRMTGTTDQSHLLLNETKILKIVEVNDTGAFADWGLLKHLLIPFSEQHTELQQGQVYPVRLCYDMQSDRLYGTTKLDKYLSSVSTDYKAGDKVDIMVWQETDLGFKVVIDETVLGLVFKSDLFKTVKIGEVISAFVKNVREDHKLDISLYKPGVEAIGHNEVLVLNALQQNDNSLPYHDKSSPEEIYAAFGISKKAFKKAIGGLYKRKKILIEKTGIRLSE